MESNNVDSPGGHISIAEYDEFGNEIRSLTAANRARVLDQGAGPTLVDTRNIFSADGLELLESFGPQTTFTLADGSSVVGRAHSTITYDGGLPASISPAPHLPTMVVVRA